LYSKLNRWKQGEKNSGVVSVVHWRPGVIAATRVIVSHLKEGKKSSFSGGGVDVARNLLHHSLSEPLGRGMIFLSRPELRICITVLKDPIVRWLGSWAFGPTQLSRSPIN
jgi:hypothetical protein